MFRKTQTLANTAIMTALSVVLSFVILWEMPQGGSVTLACMLPIMFVSIRYGCVWGLGAGAAMSFFQIMQALMHGNVFIWCQTWQTVVVCVLFDYIFPFTVIGLAGLFCKWKVGKIQNFGSYVGMLLVFVLRFLSHFLTGVVIWGQWAPEGMGKFLYSFVYNGSFLGVELLITLILGVILLESPQLRKWMTKEEKQK